MIQQKYWKDYSKVPPHCPFWCDDGICMIFSKEHCPEWHLQHKVMPQGRVQPLLPASSSQTQGSLEVPSDLNTRFWAGGGILKKHDEKRPSGSLNPKPGIMMLSSKALGQMKDTPMLVNDTLRGFYTGCQITPCSPSSQTSYNIWT